LEVFPQRHRGQPEVLEHRHGVVGVELPGVEPDVVEPVVERIFGLRAWRIEQELRLGLLAFDPQLGLEGGRLVEPDHAHALDRRKHLAVEEREKILAGVVPEHDPLGGEGVGEGVGDLFGVHALCPSMGVYATGRRVWQLGA